MRTIGTDGRHGARTQETKEKGLNTHRAPRSTGKQEGGLSLGARRRPEDGSGEASFLVFHLELIDFYLLE